MADNDRKVEIDSPNMGLVKFGIQTQTSLADNLRKTRCKWAIDDLTEDGHNNLITLLIMNIRVEFSTDMEDSLIIRRCQIDKFDCPNTNDINQVSIDVMALWKKIICSGGQPTAIDVDMEDGQFESNSSGHHDTVTWFLEPLMDEIEMLKELLTKVEYSRLSKNPQVIILCDIIQDRLPLNHL